RFPCATLFRSFGSIRKGGASMLNADVVAALLWTLLLGATYWLTLDFPPGPAGVPGPGYVPRLLVVVGLVLAVFLFRSGRRGQVEAVNWRAFGKDRLLRAGGVVGLLFDRKVTSLNSCHVKISDVVFCL